MAEQEQIVLHVILRILTTNTTGQPRKPAQLHVQRVVSCQLLQIQFVQLATQAAKVVLEDRPTQTVTVAPSAELLSTTIL